MKRLVISGSHTSRIRAGVFNNLSDPNYSLESITREIVGLASRMYKNPPLTASVPLLSTKERFAHLLSQDPKYETAMQENDELGTIPLASKYSESYIQFEKTESAIIRGKYVDQVKNAKQIIAIGDIHGDLFGLCQALLNSGAIIDSDPLIRSRDFTNLHKKYSLNPKLPSGTQIVLMGDYVDRGDYSIEVIHFIMHLKSITQNSGVSIHTICGNHDVVFQKIVKLFGSKSGDKIESALNDPKFAFNLKKELADLFSIYYCYGMDTYSIAAPQIHLDISSDSYGFKNTHISLLRNYASWENAVSKMKEDGTWEFFQSLKGAVIIDGNIFTHGGIPIFARTIAELEEYYEFAFSNHLSMWGAIGSNTYNEKTPILTMANILRYAEGEDIEWFLNERHFPFARKAFVSKLPDLSLSYIANLTYRNIHLINEWLENFGFGHMYVGHNGADRIFVQGNVTNLDARLSESYGVLSNCEVMVLDPLSLSFVRSIAYRPQVVLYGSKLLTPQIDFKETDHTNNRLITAVFNSTIGSLIQNLCY